MNLLQDLMCVTGKLLEAVALFKSLAGSNAHTCDFSRVF